MVKTAAAVAELALPEPSKPVPTVVMAWPDAFERVRRALWPARTVVAVEDPGRTPWEASSYVCFECELRDGGKVRQIDLEARLKELGLQESCERPAGPGWPT